MSGVGMVVTATATESGDLVAARLRALLAGGWDARLLCCGERWEQDRDLRDPRISSRVEFTPNRDHLRLPRQLRRRPVKLLRYLGATSSVGPFDERLLELRPDLVHFHSATEVHTGSWLRRLLDCRIVVSFREDGGDLELSNQGVQGAPWEWADLLLFQDAPMLERAALRGCPRDKAEVLASPLPNGSRPATPSDSAGGTLRVLSAGPLIWEQGFEHSVHAVRLLLDQGVGCEYRILGDGADLDPVAFARHQLDLSEHVQITRLEGNSLLDELQAADVFVDPAVTDTTSPTPLQMAQSLGIPFVATSREGLPDDAGIAVPRRNARAIAEALARLARDAALRRQMGEAGRRGADRHPTLEQHLHRLEELYRRVLA